jgi:hypothetical protein
MRPLEGAKGQGPPEATGPPTARVNACGQEAMWEHIGNGQLA